MVIFGLFCLEIHNIFIILKFLAFLAISCRFMFVNNLNCNLFHRRNILRTPLIYILGLNHFQSNSRNFPFAAYLFYCLRISFFQTFAFWIFDFEIFRIFQVLTTAMDPRRLVFWFQKMLRAVFGPLGLFIWKSIGTGPWGHLSMFFGLMLCI